MWDEGDGRDSVESRLDTDRQECRRGWQTERGSQGQVWRCLWGQHTWADVAGEWRLREAAVREWGDSSLPFPPCLPVATADLSFSCWSLSLQGLYALWVSWGRWPSFPSTAFISPLLNIPKALIIYVCINCLTAPILLHSISFHFPVHSVPFCFSPRFPPGCPLLLSPFAWPSLCPLSLLGPGFCSPFPVDDAPATGTDDHLC